MSHERRTEKFKRRMADALPVFKLYLRNKQPKEIGKMMKKPAWWIYKVLGRMK